jgi:hypothetical protein
LTGTSDLGWSERGSAQFISEGALKQKIVLPTVNFDSSLGSDIFRNIKIATLSIGRAMQQIDAPITESPLISLQMQAPLAYCLTKEDQHKRRSQLTDNADAVWERVPIVFNRTPDTLAALTQSGAGAKDLRIKRGREPIHDTPHSRRVSLGAARAAAQRAEVVVAPLINHPLPPRVSEKRFEACGGPQHRDDVPEVLSFPKPSVSD